MSYSSVLGEGGHAQCHGSSGVTATFDRYDAARCPSRVRHHHRADLAACSVTGDAFGVTVLVEPREHGSGLLNRRTDSLYDSLAWLICQHVNTNPPRVRMIDRTDSMIPTSPLQLDIFFESLPRNSVSFDWSHMPSDARPMRYSHSLVVSFLASFFSSAFSVTSYSSFPPSFFYPYPILYPKGIDHNEHDSSVFAVSAPFLIVSAVVLSPLPLWCIWFVLKDRSFERIEARACTGRGFTEAPHRFRSDWAYVDVLSYRVHRGKRLIVHYRVANRSNKPWDFSPNPVPRLPGRQESRTVTPRRARHAWLGADRDLVAGGRHDAEPDVLPA